ncbi:MAG: hypothetical protein ACTHJR_04940 [Sphingomonas sp.]|uniref:hypothetical protein n=1 Tax=Sphingomonas sp. TaxID=28214 RepID=UPI003F808FC9
MKRIALVAILALTACQPQQPSADKAELDDLRVRVRALEQGQDQIVNEIRADEAKADAKPVAAEPPAMTYELAGGKGPNRQYPTKARCEAAKAVLDEGLAISRRDAEAQGAIVVSQPTYMCVPL